MQRRFHMFAVLLIAISATQFGGCDGITNLGLSDITVEVINDTDFPVDPEIRFDDDPGFLASLFPASDLDLGLVEAGESVSSKFGCDGLGLVFSDQAQQVVFGVAEFAAGSTRILEREEDFDCGDTIRFRFVGNLDDFGVIVSVNGRVVD